MALLALQQVFSTCVAKLILYAQTEGIGVTIGEVWRSAPEAERLYAAGLGIRYSVHRDRLAVDLNCIKGGVYTTDLAPYRVLGEYWKTLHPLARWGGDFEHVDPDHFSFEWQGRS